MRIHESIQTIPIFQFSQLFETGDVRYLRVLSRKNAISLKEVSEKKMRALNTGFASFFEKLDDIDTSIQILKIEIYQEYLKYLRGSVKSKYHQLFTKYMQEIDKRIVNFTYKGKTYDSLFVLYNELRDELKNEIYKERIDIFFNIPYNYKKYSSLDENLAALRKNGEQIDKFKDTWSYYLSVLKSVSNANKNRTAKN